MLSAGDLITQFRDEVVDLVAASHLWGDAELVRFADEAQRAFCRETRGIADARTALVCSLAITAGEPYTALHSSVMQIREARRSDNTPLQVLNVGTASGGLVDDYGAGAGGAPDYETQGDVFAMVLGETDGFVRWLFKPVADDTVAIKVFRRPLLNLSTKSSELEVADEYDWILLKYMLYRAFLKNDVETFDEQRALSYEAAFYRAAGEVRREQERLVHRPRAIAYGGL